MMAILLATAILLAGGGALVNLSLESDIPMLKGIPILYGLGILNILGLIVMLKLDGNHFWKYALIAIFAVSTFFLFGLSSKLTLQTKILGEVTAQLGIIILDAMGLWALWKRL